MTKRAKHITMFVETLTDLVSNAFFVRSHAYKPQDETPESQDKHKKAKEYLEKTERTLKACMAEICENNEEQAEALMLDLGVQWRKEVKPDADNPS